MALEATSFSLFPKYKSVVIRFKAYTVAMVATEESMHQSQDGSIIIKYSNYGASTDSQGSIILLTKYHSVLLH